MNWRHIWSGRRETNIACPECGDKVLYAVDVWESGNGKPVEVSFDCKGDEFVDPDDDEDYDPDEETHHYRQSDWQPIRDQLEVLAKAEWKRIRAAAAAESEAT